MATEVVAQAASPGKPKKLLDQVCDVMRLKGEGASPPIGTITPAEKFAVPFDVAAIERQRLRAVLT